jgi:D-alanyl-D-alanine carboxypeptidase
LSGDVSPRPAAPTTTRRPRRPSAAGLVVIVAALVGVVVSQTAWSSAPTFRDLLAGDHRAATSEHDGALPNGVTVFDERYAGVADLDPDLLQALHTAAEDAGTDGVTFHVNSGWRSAAYQEQLLREAVAQYGSESEAARWVATPETSAHVSGEAVDIGSSDAAAWLSEHGAGYGLCQIYGNEPWHYELRPQAPDSGCPTLYPDPTYDPRLQPR